LYSTLFDVVGNEKKGCRFCWKVRATIKIFLSESKVRRVSSLAQFVKVDIAC
jgi:hypothetical protein